MDNEERLKKIWKGVKYTPEDVARFERQAQETLEALRTSDTNPQSSE